jgi:ABC-type nitrate/sulfonate/bicarbonate transport system ATPase subunit
VHVIGCAVDNERDAMHFANDATEVGEKIGADFGGYERLAILGAEDEMKDEISGGMRQGLSLLRSLVSS